MARLQKKSSFLVAVIVLLKFSNGQYYSHKYFTNTVQDPKTEEIKLDIQMNPNSLLGNILGNIFYFPSNSIPDSNTYIKNQISDEHTGWYGQSGNYQPIDNNIIPEEPVPPINSNNNNYCNVSPVHTMCIYPPGRSAKCAGTDYFTLSEIEKNQIVKRHNNLRSSVSAGFEGQPIASPALLPLKWNSTLADIAQRWADQCSFGHDQNRNIGPDVYNPTHQVGQNVAVSYASYRIKKFDIKYLTQGWIDEFKLIPASSIKRLVADYRYLHYTQMVWRKTREIGCGASVYQEQGWYHALLVCNYYPAGNLPGARVY